VPEQVAVQRDKNRRPVVALDDPRSNDSHHTAVPAIAPQHIRVALPHLGQFGLGFPGGPFLDRPPLRIERVQFQSNGRGAPGIVGQQQFERGIGTPETPGRVEPRRQTEAQGT
jgi:hypothetical protein